MSDADVAAVDFEAVDFFTDTAVHQDPYPYYEYLASKGPVWREPRYGMVVVTDYDHACAVFRDVKTFSSCNSSCGPIPPFPVPFEGDDVSDTIEQYRHVLPISDLFITFDPPDHTAHRGLMMRLFTPNRLRENEGFMRSLADRLLDQIIPRGGCELISEYAQPFSLLTIADLLGVPEEHHELFRRKMLDFSFGAIEGEGHETTNAGDFLSEWFTDYVEQRRREPRQDVLTKLALAEFPDGSTPEVTDVVRIAGFLFAAGQETTARMLGFALRTLAEEPDLQAKLRSDPDLIPDFVEETLRVESPVKANYRLARRTTSVGGVDVPAGTTVMIPQAAVNRDPKQFERPNEFHADRSNARSHLSFGRGIHSCPGGTLARVEARISLERILARTADVRISERHHGPAGRRRYHYEPTYILHGLTSLQLEFDAA